jgi:hypothetical protein
MVMSGIAVKGGLALAPEIFRARKLNTTEPNSLASNGRTSGSAVKS